MEMYKLVDVISTIYPIIRRKFIGCTNIQVIKNNSESIEDKFHNQLELLLILYPDHELPTYEEEFNFIMVEVRKQLASTTRIKKTTLYLDDKEYLEHDYEDGFNEYGENITLDNITDTIEYSNIDSEMDAFYEKLEQCMNTFNTPIKLHIPTHANH